jgi:hypothetical protein
MASARPDKDHFDAVVKEREGGMGFARRAVRKSVRWATPQPVRQAMHPARTVKNAVTPRPVKPASRAVYLGGRDS